MAKATLNKRFIDSIALALTVKDCFFWDAILPGFGLKVTQKQKIFLAQARVNGKKRRVTLGPYGTLTPKQGRDMATEILDPAIGRAKDKAQAVSLRQAVDSYKVLKILKPNSIKDINKHLNGNFSDWRDRPLAELTRADIKKRFKQIGKRSPAQSNQAIRLFRVWRNYAVAEYRYPDDKPVFGDNPVNILSEQGIWYKIHPRDGKVSIMQSVRPMHSNRCYGLKQTGL